MNSLEQHKVSDCDKFIVPCALKDYGCSKSIIRYQNSTHYMTEEHQNAVIMVVRHLILKLTGDKQELNSHMHMNIVTHSTTTAIPTDSNNITIQIQEMYKIIGIIVGGIQTLNEDGQRLIDAESERQTSIYSPPFYSSPTGYKMRARLYLNGDGNARRIHMSLFFVLMR
ncbi:unnamed protein product, partial [Rotaria sp. Silwood1]